MYIIYIYVSISDLYNRPHPLFRLSATLVRINRVLGIFTGFYVSASGNFLLFISYKYTHICIYLSDQNLYIVKFIVSLPPSQAIFQNKADKLLKIYNAKRVLDIICKKKYIHLWWKLKVKRSIQFAQFLVQKTLLLAFHRT